MESYIFLDLPEKKIGKFKIVREKLSAGKKICAVSMREAFFTGKKSKSVAWDTDVYFHKLLSDSGVLMSDIPQEQESNFPYVDNMKGEILVGGLGLGLVAKYLEGKKDVKKLVIVEKEKDIIKLVEPYSKFKKSEVVCADLFDYLKKCKRKFDYAYYDIWSPTGEDVLYTHVRPLRTLSEGIIRNDRIVCWQEDVMLGQLRMQLETLIMTANEPKMGILTWTDEEFSHACKWSRTRVPFMRWYRKIKPDNAFARRTAEIYVNTYCCEKGWKMIWGKYEEVSSGR